MKEIKSQNMSIKKHHEMLKFLSDNSTFFNCYNPNPNNARVEEFAFAECLVEIKLN